MVKIVIIEKNGDFISVEVNDSSDIFKRCNFRKEEGFQIRTTWTITIGQETHSIQLYSKMEGKSPTINKYEFPPPVDTEVYYGRCALVKIEEDELVDLDVDTWVSIYDRLCGRTEVYEEPEEEEEENTTESELEEEPYDYN